MKTNTLFQVRFRPSVKPPRGFTKSAHYNVTAQTDPFIGKNEYLIGNTWLPASYFIKIEVEDAPVFQKPPLRKIASLKHDEVIELGEHADLVLKQAYKEGHVWPNGSFNLDFSLPKDACLRVFEAGKIMWDHKLNYDNYNLTILPASKFVEVEAEGQEETVSSKFIMTGTNGDTYINGVKIDPPAPELKPFPDGYVIPNGTRVIVVSDAHNFIKKGSIGVTDETHRAPYIKWEDEHAYKGRKDDWAVYCTKLAPLDPRDHPEHPEFGKQKQEETITQAQKDECRKIDDEIFQNPFSNQGELLERNNQLTGQIETMKRLAKIALSNEDYEHMRVILRAIANGEI